MAATGSGLTRRRGGATGALTDENDSENGRVSSPIPKPGASSESRTPETSYTGGENGHKIAFDPRDISESEERNKQPKLTLMEEVLLLGLKDKQVRRWTLIMLQGPVTEALLHRATCLSGTTIYRMHYGGASSSSLPSGVASACKRTRPGDGSRYQTE